ncbi:MAG TPA: riboflavin synthase [Acidimicrobiia bacterium]|nr:riboflavin synthase [Acidimicrobiia bacterium]
MFTGIVEHRGSVVSVERADGVIRLTVDTGPLGEIPLGGSMAVNGVCLTAVEATEGQVGFDVVAETLDRSTLGALLPGDPVNLERPMRADGRFDGHIVQGHVDGVGEISAIEPEGDGLRIAVRVPEGLSRYLVEKGSVTVDGVSLTVAGVDGFEIQLALIPHSLEVTTLGLRRVGEKVNLEIDVLAKYVEKLLRPSS